MENKVYSDELQHWGIKGQKWGIRRYQNSDGTLTAAGQKRYNKEMEKVKKEAAKVKEAEKIAANKKKTQAKIDKLNSKKQELEDRKNALEDEKKAAEIERKKQEEAESVEERRERLLKSTDAKELYKNKDLLTSAELNERINRIDMETRLKSKIVEEHHKTGLDYMDSATNTINKSTNLFRSVDNAFSTVSNSFIGKTLMKKLGLEPPAKKPDTVGDIIKKYRQGKIDKKALKEAYEAENILGKLKDIEDRPKREAEKKAKEEAKAAEAKAKAEADRQAKEAKAEADRQAKEAKYADAKKQVEDYFNKLYSEPDTSGRYSLKGNEITDRVFATVDNSKILMLPAVSSASSAGQDYLSNNSSLLALPAPKDDD